MDGRMSDLHLTFACGPYDRTQALRDGSIWPEGIDLTYLALQPAEIFWRMLQYHEFDISEMSLSNYTTLVSTGNSAFVAIPVFPSRVFRHGYFFINTKAGIRSPSDLRGKRGGDLDDAAPERLPAVSLRRDSNIGKGSHTSLIRRRNAVSSRCWRSLAA
jgi:hypothetical protein